MKTVVLLGKGSLAVKIAEFFKRSREWELAYIVPVTPEPQWAESLQGWAIRNGIPVAEDYRKVPLDGIDLAFSVYYDKIIKQPFIDKCEKILNLHNAPLPRYRGVRPINWALKNGETSHGVTIHEIEAGIDCGPIYGQWHFPIDPVKDEVWNVYEMCLDCGWKLFLDVMGRLDSIVPVPQDETKATYYSAAMNDQLWERAGWTREESAPEYFRQLERLESDFADRLVMS